MRLKYLDELENAQVRLLLVTSNLLHSDACVQNVRGGRTATGGEADRKEMVGEEAGLANRTQLMKDVLRKNREFSSSLDNEKPLKGCCEGQ